MAGPIRIAILANGAQARREITSTANAAETLGSKAARAGKRVALGLGVGVVAAGVGLKRLGTASVRLASDSQQSLGATETVFKRYADTVTRRSDKAARSLGLSANEYRELSNVVGASLKGAGVPLEKTTALTGQLNKRAADLAATFGGTTSEAVQAFSSLLRGEADPIERYGISVKQSDVNARLAAKGLDGLTGSALKQAEMQARLDLAFRQSKDSSGAFARESNTLAGVQQRIGAQAENIGSKIGTALLPVLTQAGQVISRDVLPQVDGLVDRFGPKLTSALSGVVAGIGPVLDKLPKLLKGGGDASPTVSALTSIAASARDLKPAVTGAASSLPSFLDLLNVSATVMAFAADNTDLLVKALPLLVVGYAAVKTAQLAANIAAAATVPIKIAEVVVNRQLVASNKALIASRAAGVPATVAANAAEATGTAVRSTGIVSMIAHKAATIASTVATTAATVAQRALNLALRANPIGLVITAIALLAAGVVLAYKRSETFRNIVDKVAKVIKNDVLPAVSRFAGFLAGVLVSSVRAGISIVTSIVSKVSAFGSAVIDGAGKVTEFAGKVRQKISDVVGFFTSLPDKIKGALSGAGTWLVETGKNIVQGLLNGLDTAKQWVIDKVRELADLVPGWLRKRLGIASPSKVTKKIGEWAGKGLELGIKGSGTKVADAAEKLAEKINARLEEKLNGAKGIRESILSMRDSLASTLTGDLFGGTGDESGTALDKFRAGLDTAKAKAAEVAKSVRTLLDAKVGSGFLQNLVQSGNSELIVQLAGAPDVASLSAQYDAVIAQNEDTSRLVAEQVIGHRLDDVNNAIAYLTNEMARYALENREESKKPLKVRIDLGADAVPQIERGRRIQQDLDAFRGTGGRSGGPR